MATGYIITIVFILLFVLHRIILKVVTGFESTLSNPQHQKMAELLKSGQVFRGKAQIHEDNRVAVYTVNLRLHKKTYEYQTFKDGVPVEEIREKKFEQLASLIEQRGIIQLDELELPF